MIGAQEPTFKVVPEIADSSTADDAFELLAVAGVQLLEWQRDQVRTILGLNAEGGWAATRYGCAVPRQSGKGIVIEAVVLAKTLLLGERVLWTAHHGATMLEAFTRFRGLLESHPALRDQVSAFRASTGREQIEFTNGALVKFSARSKSAARGLGFRTIVADEAQEWTRLDAGAMLPVLSGQGDARTQTLLFGTPPYDRRGEVFADMRAAAYTGGDDRLAWSEWSCAPSDDPADPEVWARTNPSLGTIIMVDKITDEFAQMQGDIRVFRRERLGEWGRTSDEALALDEDCWAAGRTGGALHRDDLFTRSDGDVRFFGVDTTFNAEMTTVVEAVPLRGGEVGLRVVEAGEGLGWITRLFRDLRGQTPHVVVSFDPARVGDLARDLADAGIRDHRKYRRIVSASGRDLTLACDGLVRVVREGRLRHADPRLDAAAAGATRSTFDDGRGWKLVGINGADVSPLIAGALALRALREHAPSPVRKRPVLI